MTIKSVVSSRKDSSNLILASSLFHHFQRISESRLCIAKIHADSDVFHHVGNRNPPKRHTKTEQLRL